MAEANSTLNVSTRGAEQVEAQLHRIAAALNSINGARAGGNFDFKPVASGILAAGAVNSVIPKDSLAARAAIRYSEAMSAGREAMQTAKIANQKFEERFWNQVVTARITKASQQAKDAMINGKLMNFGDMMMVQEYARANSIVQYMRKAGKVISAVDAANAIRSASGFGGAGLTSNPRAGFAYVPGIEDFTQAIGMSKKYFMTLLREAAPYAAGLTRFAGTAGAGIAIGYGLQREYQAFFDYEATFNQSDYNKSVTATYQATVLGRKRPAFGLNQHHIGYTAGLQEWKKKNAFVQTLDVAKEILVEGANTFGSNNAATYLNTPEMQELSTEVLPLARFLSSRSDVIEMAKRAAGKDKAQRQQVYREFIIEYNVSKSSGFNYQQDKRKKRIRANAGVA